MKTVETLTHIRTEVIDLLEKGQEQISSSALIQYLDNLIRMSVNGDVSAVEIEKYKASLQKWIADHRHNAEQDLENFRSVITMGQNAIRASILLNGGASVAMLAFIADLAKGHPALVPDYAFCMAIFVFGALLATIVSGMTYLSQWLGAYGQRKWGFGLNIACIASGIACYGVFTWGLYATYSEFLLFPVAI
ncbi:hypothetical protein [Nisaea sp.]|uniref:hypothetical protein n=1 Tax=Nisaea sp. TaxID=2024842 RepID=UPI0032EB19AA